MLKYNKRPNNFKRPLIYKPILLSDSKENYLRKYSHIIEEKGYSIGFVCRGGLRFLDQFYWLIGCFGLNGPLRQYFSLYRAVSLREGVRGEKG